MMRLIIDFAYKGTVNVTEENVQGLVQTADQLNVTRVVHACCSFLEDRLASENCVGIWQLTNTCFCPLLRAKACLYIMYNFNEVVSTEEFLQLSAEELAYVLNSDELSVIKETSAYDAVLKWLAHAPAERKGHFPLLLSKVRLALTTVEFLYSVLSSPGVRSNPECHEMVRGAMRMKHLITACKIPSAFCSNVIARPRLPKDVLFAIGGWSNLNPVNAIETYDINTNQWLDVTDEREHARAYHGTVLYDGSIYCIGGYSQQDSTNTVRRFDLADRSWHEAAPMNRRRCYVSAALLGGHIYGVGGRDGSQRLKCAERYKPESNQWSYIESMHEHRSDASCASYRERVYICGGFNGSHCLFTCEYYSPRSNHWTVFTPMTCQRSGFSIVVYADKIFAVGGFDGNVRLTNVEAYSSETNAWAAAPPMQNPRSNFGIGLIDNKIFVTGGFHSISTINFAEFYDSVTNKWSKVAPMGTPRSALGCCVVSMLPNVRDYVMARQNLPYLNATCDPVRVEHPEHP
ncbi:kelch-like protein 10 [Brachionichthys hirsutus]|uniref:kelch-like protein 10 n=1 Tax=Brachionichthys hirsutus TaxID=412623 RepID=UPI0036043A06